MCVSIALGYLGKASAISKDLHLHNLFKNNSHSGSVEVRKFENISIAINLSAPFFKVMSLNELIFLALPHLLYFESN
jgi:hypothetical protein